MGSEQLLLEGLSLLVLGMGTVFLFLAVLVFVTSSMSALVIKYSPVTPVPPIPAPGDQLNDQTLLAVISAAVHAHRCKKSA